MKITFVTTIFNEEKTIERLLHSLVQQTQLPDEVVIVDGGSTDATASVISNFQFPISNKFSKIILFEKKGNRSVGRNEGITKATGDVIVLSDAGCVLDKDFIKEIVKPFSDKRVDVVAGYYRGEGKTIFQKCLIPYVLVMPDKVNSDAFLPATRSMAIRKKVWSEMGGFPEEYSHNEDYVFAKKLQKHGKKIQFASKAIVMWIPRKNLKEAFTMFYRFALGDAEAGILRPKVIFLLARYSLGLVLTIFALYNDLWVLLWFLFILFILYLFWAIKKNYRYVSDPQAYYLLPILQLVSDMAVIRGTVQGIIMRYGI